MLCEDSRMRLSKKTEATYTGGSKDGMLVRPSMVKDIITFTPTLPIIHRENFFDGDYPFGIDEYYYYEENNGKVVFKLGKTEKKEIIEI